MSQFDKNPWEQNQSKDKQQADQSKKGFSDKSTNYEKGRPSKSKDQSSSSEKGSSWNKQDKSSSWDK